MKILYSPSYCGSYYMNMQVRQVAVDVHFLASLPYMLAFISKFRPSRHVLPPTTRHFWSMTIVIRTTYSIGASKLTV